MSEFIDWAAVQERMQPGHMTRDGMLGQDKRSPAEVIADDDATVRRLDVTHRAIAQRLRAIQEAARELLGDVTVIEGKFEVRCDESRGILTCPFGHPGHFLKCVTYLKHLPSGRTMQWTDLGIHMAQVHGFYEGKGAPYRIEPADVVELLGVTTARVD